MKKILAILCLLGLSCTLWACQQEKKPLAEAELYVYDAFMEKESEPAEFTLEGKLPGKKQKTGDFSGRITVEDADGTRHVYKNLTYCWSEDMLILYRGDPTAEKGEGVLCWIDPENPEKAVLADRNWSERAAVLEMIAYADDGLSDAEARSLGTAINRLSGVERARFIHREDALAELTEDPAFAGVDASALRHRYVITVKAENAEKTAEQIREIAGIAEVQYSLWAPESIRILGYKQDGEKMAQLLEKLPELPEE